VKEEADGHCAAGVEAQARGDQAAAAGHYLAGVKCDPSHAQCLIRLGLVRTAEEAYDEAEQYLKRAAIGDSRESGHAHRAMAVIDTKRRLKSMQGSPIRVLRAKKAFQRSQDRTGTPAGEPFEGMEAERAERALSPVGESRLWTSAGDEAVTMENAREGMKVIFTLIHAILTPIHAILTPIHAILTPIHAILTRIHAML